MAPNTNFNYRIDLKEQPFVPGNYTVKIKVNDGYQDYSWEKHLVIQEKEAKNTMLPPSTSHLKNTPISLETGE